MKIEFIGRLDRGCDGFDAYALATLEDSDFQKVAEMQARNLQGSNLGDKAHRDIVMDAVLETMSVPNAHFLASIDAYAQSPESAYLVKASFRLDN